MKKAQKGLTLIELVVGSLSCGSASNKGIKIEFIELSFGYQRSYINVNYSPFTANRIT